MSPLRKGNDQLGVVSPTTDAQQLPAEAQGLLDTALQREREEHWEQYAVLGPKKTRELDEFVTEQSIQTIFQWFSVNNEDLGTPNPNPYVLVPAAALGEHEKVSGDRLTQGDVNYWVDHWWFKGLLSEPSNVHALNTIPHEIDAATEHRRRIEELRENKEEKNQHD